jgi:hypothetical protein
VVLLSPFFRDGVGKVKYCWNRRSSNFSFQNKFIIVLPLGHQVDNNTFLSVCLFKRLAGYIYVGCYETKIVYFNNNKIKGNEKLLWLFKLYFAA